MAVLESFFTAETVRCPVSITSLALQHVWDGGSEGGLGTNMAYCNRVSALMVRRADGFFLEAAAITKVGILNIKALLQERDSSGVTD